MSDSKLYTIELGGDLGDIAIMHRLVRCKDCANMSRNPFTKFGCICKVRACFWFWAVTNVMWLAWDASSGLWARAVMDVVQFALAIWGLHEWGKAEA